jgi:hypothetical protein
MSHDRASVQSIPPAQVPLSAQSMRQVAPGGQVTGKMQGLNASQTITQTSPSQVPGQVPGSHGVGIAASAMATAASMSRASGSGVAPSGEPPATHWFARSAGAWLP